MYRGFDTRAVGGLARVWRAAGGPLKLAAFAVNSPLNLQCIFGLSATALLFMNSQRGDHRADPVTGRSVVWLLAILLVTAGTLWQAVRFPLVFDDYTLTYRSVLLGGIGGYRDPATGAPAILGIHPLGYIKGFALRIWSAFYFPINWSHEPETWLVLMLLAYLGALAWMTMRARSARLSVVLGLAFTLVALLPIGHMLLVDASLLGAGRFYLALAGFAMFLGVVVRGTPKPMQVLVGAVLVAFQIAALRHNLAVWGETAALADRTCAAAAKIAQGHSGAFRVSGLPRDIDGVPFLANGLEACIAFHEPHGESAAPPRP